MNGMLALLIAPLAVGLVVALRDLWRDQEPRLVVSVLIFPALAARHLLMPPALAESVAELMATPYASALALELGINTIAAVTVVTLARSLRERNRAERVQWDSMEAVRALSAVLIEHRGTFEEGVPELLELGCQRLGLEVGVYATIDNDSVEVVAVHPRAGGPIKAGDGFPLADTLCHAALAADAPLSIEQLSGSHWAPAATEHTRRGIESYLGTIIRANEVAVATLYFASSEMRRTRFTGVDRQLLTLMAEWLGAEIERGQLARNAAESLQRAKQAEAARPEPTVIGGRGRLIPRRGEALDRRRLDVNAAITQLEGELRDACEGGNRLQVSLAPGNPIALLHRHEFDRVLYSLFWQTLEVSDGSGDIRLSIETPTPPPGIAAPAFLTLTLSAEGRALDNDGVAGLFADRASTAPIATREGRLSLARAQRLLQTNAGDLSVHSDPNSGTTLTAYLPVWEDAAQAAAPA